MNFFGTDGIRGKYGEDLTVDSAFLLGKSLALYGGDCPIVVIGKDTRTSGDALFSALAEGVYDGGGNVINLGILPTNAVAHFTRKFGGDFGVMITASHNPPCDNGLKVFDTYGVKLCLSKQKAISSLMDAQSNVKCSRHRLYEPIFYDIDNIYVSDVLSAVKPDCSKLSIALDLCHGAACKVAPAAFERAGASVSAINCTPNGKLINVNCGATCPQTLAQFMQGKGFHLGFAFDGDADRLSVVEDGNVLSGGRVFYAIAKYLKHKGKLPSGKVCGTTLTNEGVSQALSNLGITLLRADVGDANVFNTMAMHKLNFGGEDSGHYLLTKLATGSDAIVNALLVTQIYAECGSLTAYTQECIERQSLSQNINVTDANRNLTEDAKLAATTARVTALYPGCKVVLRKSGTESKLRVYLEGDSLTEAMDCITATFAK